MTHQLTKNKKAGRKSCKEICDYLDFTYLDPIGEQDGEDKQLRMTLENKRVKRTVLSRIFEQALANTPPGWIPVVSIRPHYTPPGEAFVVIRGKDFLNILEQLRDEDLIVSR